jgi:excinuclease ABC subunit A
MVCVDTLSVRGAAEHNLKGIDVDLPRGALVVVSGVSGSGKSSLAFDTICREAQRRYLETFSSYARQFLGRVARPAVRSIDGLSPAIAVDQRTTLRNPRSTVGTLSGLYDDLRLLYARLGTAPPGVRPDRQLFSFNSPHGACPVCQGLGVEDRLDPDLIVADPAKSIRQGALVITTPSGYVIYSQVTIDVLDQVCRAHGFDVDTPWRDLTDEQRRIVLHGSDRIRIPYGKHPLASRMRWTGITAKPREEGVYKGILPVMEQILARSRNRNILRFVRSLPCKACGGARLRPEALAVRFRGRHIGEMAALDVEALAGFLRGLTLGAAEAPVADPIRAEMLGRADLFARLGLDHLTLDRGSTTLSGGEAQRIRLASQVGSGLGGVLYVFDEPSIGLHPVDQSRLLDVLATLRDRGNTVLVVEHDEDTMRRADWLVDVGPGAGEHGGELLFSGPAGNLVSAADPRSPTRAFLAGERGVRTPATRRAGSGVLRLTGARRHNLAGIDVEFLLGALNVVTGVSGAGKSSLVDELIERLPLGRVAGGERVGKVIAVDQSPIGRTPRSNPATYTGLSDVVRDLFAASPDAVARGYGKGRFSFNVVGGRCEACQGAGVLQIGMHFLGQVDVVCGTCGGKRFNDETLEIGYRGRSIHDVLELTLEDAGTLLADQPRAARVLDVLRELGLGYLRLGQPSTTLSGGEAQRVKLAAELARPGRGHTLYVLDEPTTGLHRADVGVLLAALDRLVGQGHTVVTIEHHLDVVRSADRVIDLGPGSGRRGGRLVVSGTPDAVAACEASATGAALRARTGGLEAPTDRREPPTDRPSAPTVGHRAPADTIRFNGVRTHNLQNIDVEIPSNRLTVVTGVSGSGKSSLAFDTIYAEGRNRFTESFSAYARRFLEKTGDAVFERASGLVPAVAIRQRTASRNPRSTVGTMTEIADYYRLLFARVGVVHCPSCRIEVAMGPDGDGPGGERGRCPRCAWRAALPLTATMFSPNAEQGACPACKGLGGIDECDPEQLVTHPDRSLFDGAMDGHKTGRFYGDPHGQHLAILRAAASALGVDVSGPWAALGEAARALVLRGAGPREFEVEWHYRRGTRSGVHRFRAAWLGLAAYLGQEYERKHADRRGEALEPLMRRVTCPACLGAKLGPASLAVRVAGRNIAQWLARTVAEGLALLDEGGPGGLGHARDDGAWSARDAQVTADLRRDVVARLERLRDGGLDYLSLDRPASTLSAGEAQRVRLATEVGTGLTGIAYVLDEPTAGLHPRDTRRLLRLLTDLRDAGNTVVVVEHDEDVIRAADHVIDLGPGAGPEGGRLVAAGPPAAIAASPTSLTGRYLRDGAGSKNGRSRRPLRPGIGVRNARCHNLKNLDVDIPVGGLVVVTGVSGSGKSTLVFDVIAPALASPSRPRADDGGTTVVLDPTSSRVVVADRDAAGSAPSSMPATIVGIFDAVRGIFASTDAARALGLTKRDFSTNVKGGRCETCEGVGRVRVSMDFLPDVWVPCGECDGRRYQARVLQCAVDGRSVADVLEMTVREGRAAFSSNPAIDRALGLLDDLGLGYLQIGQGADSLSGGERQRLRLATELLDEGRGPAVFLFDEPTTGLHFDDVARLLQVFDRLIDAGHSLLVVEHNLDVIGAADWVLDLGPEGGDRGGRVVAAGSPEQVAAVAGSWTGQALSARARGGRALPE